MFAGRVLGLSKDADPTQAPRFRTAFTVEQVSTLESSFRRRHYLAPWSAGPGDAALRGAGQHVKLLVFVSLGSDFHISSSPSAGSQKETEVAALPTETLKPGGSGTSAMPSRACAGQHWAPRIEKDEQFSVMLYVLSVVSGVPEGCVACAPGNWPSAALGISLSALRMSRVSLATSSPVPKPHHSQGKDHHPDCISKGLSSPVLAPGLPLNTPPLGRADTGTSAWCPGGDSLPSPLPRELPTQEPHPLG
ncbi:Homeobox Protein Ventx [Manis pentadactyla]|nr:Homeobox Protein Ventx [Manis pentadactyla]